MSHDNASLANDALMIFGSLGGSAAIRFGQAAYAAMPPHASTKFMPEEGIRPISRVEAVINETLNGDLDRDLDRV